jgi:single-stranded-DNA-specific exonuclease
LTALAEQLSGVDLLLTCDTGVTEHAAVTHAQERGVTVLITDHHDLPPELPPAAAVVDPKRLPSEHPLRELPGVGVAYKLMQELYLLLRRPPAEIETQLDLVALGIVADVATQSGDTRYLLQRGMQRLRRTERIGLKALMHIANITPDHLDTDHIGFGLGPRLNAVGRLGDANLAVELLTTDDRSRARILAAQLEGLNGRRRLLTDQITAAAQEQIARDPERLLGPHALVISAPHWHPGVIGIVASRLAETYERPTVLISQGKDGQGRGSARSVPGVDIHGAICATEDLLTRHGGHPGAAGLSLPVENIPAFRHALSHAVDEIWDRDVQPGLAIDAVLPWSQLSLALVDTLNTLAPFGAGNPAVALASRDLTLVAQQVFGRDQAHRRLTVRDADGTTYPVIWWRGAESAPPDGTFELAYRLKASDYKGERSLQIEYLDARILAAPPVEVTPPPIQVIDQRQVPSPRPVLERLSATTTLQIWAEGEPVDASPGRRRDQLTPAPVLAIWTPPPGPRELRAVLDQVIPQEVHLFSVPSQGTAPERFMRRLAGLIKYTLRHKDGLAELETLAAASAQRAETVRAGIHLLAARGDVQILHEGNTTMQLAPGTKMPQGKETETAARLRALLQETAAYRAYFARTAAERLIP